MLPAVRSRVVHAAISPTGRFVATASPVDGVRIYSCGASGSYGAGEVTQVDALPLWDCAQVAFVEDDYQVVAVCNPTAKGLQAVHYDWLRAQRLQTYQLQAWPSGITDHAIFHLGPLGQPEQPRHPDPLSRDGLPGPSAPSEAVSSDELWGDDDDDSLPPLELAPEPEDVGAAPDGELAALGRQEQLLYGYSLQKGVSHRVFTLPLAAAPTDSLRSRVPSQLLEALRYSSEPSRVLDLSSVLQTVRGLAFDRRGDRVLLHRGLSTVELRDLRDGHILAMLQSSNSLGGLGLSPDGRLAFICEEEGGIRCYNLRTGQIEWTLPAPPGTFSRVDHLSERGLLALWRGRAVLLMSETEGQPSLELDGVLAMDRSGSRVALLDTEGDCQLLRIETGRATAPQQLPRPPLPQVTMLPSGVSTGGTEEPKPAGPHKTPARPASAGILLDCPELPGLCWVGGRRGCALKLWHIEEARQLGELHGTGHDLTCAAISGSGRFLVLAARQPRSMGRSALVTFWDLRAGALLGGCEGRLAGRERLVFSSTEEVLWGSADNSVLQAYSVLTGQRLGAYWHDGVGRIRAVAMDKDQQLWTLHDDGHARRFDPQARQYEQELALPVTRRMPARLCHLDGPAEDPSAVTHAASFNGDGRLSVLELHSGRLQQQSGALPLLPSTSRALPKELVPHPELPLLASRSGDGSVTIWDAQTAQRIRTLAAAPSYPVRGGTLHLFGDLLLTICAGPQLQLWRVSTGRLLEQLDLPADLQRCLVIPAGTGTGAGAATVVLSGARDELMIFGVV